MILFAEVGKPLITNDAVVLGVLMICLALIFHTSSLKTPFWQKFYRYIPALLLCYFIPALLNWPLNLIGSTWYNADFIPALIEQSVIIPENFENVRIDQAKKYIESVGCSSKTFSQFETGTKLYKPVTSRFLLPAALILLCLSIDIKGLLRLGPKAIIMFLAATLGIILGGPIALLVVKTIFPDLISIPLDDLWKGMATIAGSWIGGGANQTAMKEIFEVPESIFGIMIVVDVIVANIWMAFLLYGAGVSDKIDKTLKADNSMITDLKRRMQDYQESVARKPNTTLLMILFAVAFGGVAIAHFGADILTPIMESNESFLKKFYLQSFMSSFFWLIVIATTIGVILSFTKAKQLEGVGASKIGSVFIYLLVATIGVKMNLGEIFLKENLSLFIIGFTWMIVHVSILLLTAKIIRAPFFFVAVGSQANIGGAASAPIVASAFHPSLASVGAIMAVLGYALGTFGALACALIMQVIATG